MMLLFVSLQLYIICCLSSSIKDANMLPPLGWSSWNSVKFQVNDSFIRESAKLLSSNLLEYGYNYILIDDGWPACNDYATNDKCKTVYPRDSTTQRIVVDSNKFPYGFKNLSDYVHSVGLKFGIYTSVSDRTCGGYTGSLGYEQIDAKAFVDWGFDFVKHDTCSDQGYDNSNCGSTNGCIQNSTYYMGYYLNLYSSNNITYYVDDGNPSTSYRLFNPNDYHCTYDNTIKLAHKSSQLIYEFVNQAPFFDNKTNTSVVNMFKSWFDRQDNWNSVFDNLHQQIGLSIYQRCGIFNMADMLTTAQGDMSFTQYKSEFLLWSILSTPLIFGATLQQLLNDQNIVNLITNKEIIAVNQDIDCTEASMLRMHNSWEMWGKTVHGGDVIVVVVNKSLKNGDGEVTVMIHPFGYEGDFYPMFQDYNSGSFDVRDLVQQKDLGTFYNEFTVKVNETDAVMLRFSNFKVSINKQN